MDDVCEFCNDKFLKKTSGGYKRYKTTTVLTPKAVKKLLPAKQEAELKKSFVCFDCTSSFRNATTLRKHKSKAVFSAKETPKKTTVISTPLKW